MWRRNWSTDWHGSGRFVEKSPSPFFFSHSVFNLKHFSSFLLAPSFSLHTFSLRFLLNSTLLKYLFQGSPCASRFSLQDVQLKVKAYILGTDMSNFKYDDFIVVLDVISRYTTQPEQTAHPLFLLIGLHYLAIAVILFVKFFFLSGCSSFIASLFCFACVSQ